MQAEQKIEEHSQVAFINYNDIMMVDKLYLDFLAHCILRIEFGCCAGTRREIASAKYIIPLMEVVLKSLAKEVSLYSRTSMELDR